jgi:GDP-L-fucose synthase
VAHSHSKQPSPTVWSGEPKVPLFDLTGKRVYVAGHRGMVGAALVRRLSSENCEILTVERNTLDLRDQADTDRWIDRAKPHVVVLAAAKVGGIAYNNAYPVDFLSDNLAIALNVINASFLAGVGKLLFLGSSCIYPRAAPQPMTEDIIKLVEAYRRQYGADFISVMPTNLYGPGDNYHPEHSHVPAALIRRMHEAKISGAPTVTIWGSGKPRREFLAVDDLADACIFVLKHYSGSNFLNVGTGTDINIAEFAQLVAEVIGYDGKFVLDPSRPDGAPQKLLDVSELTRLGWRAKIPLREGIAQAYADFLAKVGDGKSVQLEQNTL